MSVDCSATEVGELGPVGTLNGNVKYKLQELMYKNEADSPENRLFRRLNPLFSPHKPSFWTPKVVFAREMGRRYRENGDGWDSMCRAADKLSLINGFSPGHLISLALSLKSNLTLCMSVNINKPSTLHSNVIYCVAHGARQGSQFDGEDGSSVCLKWGQRGEKSRQILLSFQTFIKTEQV